VKWLSKRARKELQVARAGRASERAKQIKLADKICNTVPFRLVLRNGMLPPVPVLTVRIDRVVPSPWSKKRSGTYALHIGRVLKVEHWDSVKKRPN
jgi:hypothetical protein